ncbi:glycosyltransferase family 4 protein [Pararhizobium haloflavum]|uniref:glycosyltransferase family 4 protein n=1 Tax=Pararhizobium haloflavum TaxID=2037914 RepID=UPI000C17C9F5|nr:glycosyltransferase family 4 protein [Pararhizobium haloflavum]
MEISFFIPGDIEQPTGGYGYARQIIACWKAMGITCEVVRLADDYPFPSERSLRETAALLSRQPAARPILIDGLAYGAMPTDIIAMAPGPVNVLLHHPLGLETGLSERTSQALIASEKAALKLADHVIVTSHETARTIGQLLSVREDRITVALPGTDRRTIAPRTTRPPLILTVASILPRKGHVDLVAALERIKELDWNARFVGSVSAAPDTVTSVKDAIVRAGLERRIELQGPLTSTELDAAFKEASVFALPSHYEGYGMVFAEALAAGLPIVGYHAGAVPDVVPPDAGILVEPSDVSALSGALAKILCDDSLAAEMARRAAWHGQRLPRWQDTARRIADAIDGNEQQ